MSLLRPGFQRRQVSDNRRGTRTTRSRSQNLEIPRDFSTLREQLNRETESNSSSRRATSGANHKNNVDEHERPPTELVFPQSFELLPRARLSDLDSLVPGVPHEQQRKFRCRFCGKGYRWKSTMRRHETVECGDKPPAFQCPRCPYKARQRGNLNVHYKRHHQAALPFDDTV